MAKVESVAYYGNLIEGVFWIAMGAGFALSAIWCRHRLGRLIGAAALVAFGCSDFVEMQTGAWWDPWWLIVWKGACNLVFVVLVVLYVLARREEKARSGSSTTRWALLKEIVHGPGKEEGNRS
ncbi:MAG TPA: hypothetical protein VNA25_07970 [Phycisphaerae bacterium]|nr:hypothetical protein [Phycisphaerae bacterium]HUT57775.1 hypothetical protein [Phycisphaerae bacterium]